MFKTKFVKAIILVMCIMILSVGVAFANGDENDLLEKQREIDQYIFEEHAEEISEKGIAVTHTGPMEDYVEIGITPFSEENANYFYEIFGKDSVKVIEGEQAVLYDVAVQSNETPSADSTKAFPMMYVGVGILLLIGAMIVIRKLKVSTK